MNIQASRIHKVDVGTPPPSLSKDNDNEWEMVEVRYHDFENLTTNRYGSVYSPEFTCFGHQWRLGIFPRDRDGTVGTFLYNMTNKSIKIQFGFSVKNKESGWSGFVSPKEGTEFSPGGTGTEGDNDDGVFSGCGTGLTRTQIINALVDGTLVLEVRMKNIGDTTTSAPFIPDNPFVKTILSMFNDEESADVVFEVENEKVETSEHKRAKTTIAFHAHRNILQKCCKSTLLGELCKAGGEVDTTVSITDVNPEIFRHLLYYVYGGKVSDEELKANANEIIDAADKYEVMGLKLEAEASLVTSTTITIENMMDNLLYADSMNCALLQEVVMDFIAKNIEEVSNQLTFENVPGRVIPDLLAAMSRKIKSGKEGGEDLNTMRVSELRKKLHEKGLDIDGSRKAMIETLKEQQES